MKKSITSKLIFGIIALVVIIGAGILVFGKHSNANLGASVYGIPAGTITPRTICIRSGQFMSPPSVTVTSPNGGEVYAAGQQITVTWTSCNLPSTTTIALNTLTNQVSNAGFGMSNAGTYIFPNTGTATVNLPVPTSIPGWQNGNHFKIRVLATLNPANSNSVLLTDDSDNTFTINPAQLTLTSPNSGTFYQGQAINITWNGGTSSLPIHLDLANSAQQTVASIVGSAPYGNGSYSWIIPSTVAPGTYRIFIEENQAANSWDWQYGGTFTIVNNGIVVAPNGTPTATAVALGGGQQHQVVTFSIPFSVTAPAQTAYIPYRAAYSTVVTATNAVEYAIDSGGANLVGGTGNLQYTGSGVYVPDANGNYMIPVGQTKNFVLTVTYQPSVVGPYRASLINVNWNANDSATAYNTYTAGLSTNQYRTPYIVAQ